jgi:transposase
MEVVHSRCAGLDVHAETVVACTRICEKTRARYEVRTFSTTTSGLERLKERLIEEGVTDAAMESTGVYWKPVWHVLEGAAGLILANAMQVRNLPGRKTDVSDARWLADLLAHGLIRGSVVPPTQFQDLRDLTRTRTKLLGERARHAQRIQKVLEDANVKLTEIVSDVLGVTGRALVEALIGGEQIDEAFVTACRRGRMKSTTDQMLEALRGCVRPNHRFLLDLHLRQYDALTRAVEEVERRLDGLVQPHRVQFELLTTIPGVKAATAHILLAEIGPDPGRFPTSGHLVSWAGLCPVNDESAGKRRSTALRKGRRWLKTALVQAAWPASRKADSYFRAQFLRLRARRGPKKAIVAVAASILTAAYHILSRGVPYRDLGLHHFDDRERDRTAKRLVRRLQDLGLQVAIKPAA